MNLADVQKLVIQEKIVVKEEVWMSSTLFVSNLGREAHLKVPLDCKVGPITINVVKRGCFEHTALSRVDSVLNGFPWGKA